MSRKLKTLIVDDDPVLRMVITKELASVQIETQGASSGSEAIELLKTYTPDFILMDIRMPDQDGIDATRWIRDLPSVKKDIPIFALTSFSQPEHTQELLDNGFNEHLIKPFNLARLSELLKKYFRDI